MADTVQDVSQWLPRPVVHQRTSTGNDRKPVTFGPFFDELHPRLIERVETTKRSEIDTTRKILTETFKERLIRIRITTRQFRRWHDDNEPLVMFAKPGS